MPEKKRCEWPSRDPLMLAYHDKEWGVPVHDDRKLFEFLVLDAFQAGLSWAIILKKRENLRKALANFNAEKIARFDRAKISALKQDAGIIRNRAKIESTITNAQNFLKIQEEYDSFDKYIWQFTDYQTIRHKFRTIRDLPSKNKESDAMSKDLKEKGFKFVGSTICYAFMQAAGMVNDHLIHCYRYKQLSKP